MSDDSIKAHNKRIYRRVLLAVGVTDTPALIKSLSVGKSTAYEWERGERQVPQKWLKKIAQEKGLSIDWFFALEADEIEGAPSDGDAHPSKAKPKDPISLKFGHLEQKYRRLSKKRRSKADYNLDALDTYLDRLEKEEEE
jgi:hypothetical protein